MDTLRPAPSFQLRGLIVLLLLADIVGLATLLASAYDVIALVVFPALWVLGVALSASRSPEDRQILVRLFTLSFLLRVAVVLVVYRFGLVHMLGDEDSSGWIGGWGIAQAWKGDPEFSGVHPHFLNSLRQTNQGYYYLAGLVLYVVDSPSRVSLALFSAFAGALTATLIFRIALPVFGRESAARAGMLVALFPSLVVWSAQTLKEPFVILFECAVVYAVLSLRARRSSAVLALCLVSLFCLYTVRFYAAYLSVVSATLVFLWAPGPRRAQAPLMGALLLSLAVVGLFASGLWKTEAERLSRFDLAWLQSFRSNVATGPGGGSGILLPYDVSSPVGVLAALPLSLLAFLLSPFPWQALEGSARLKFAIVDVMIWWWLIPKVVSGLRTAWRAGEPIVGHLMLFVLPLTIFYALTFGNAGLAFRERAQILVLLLVFAGFGFGQKQPSVLAGETKRRLRTTHA